LIPKMATLWQRLRNEAKVSGVFGVPTSFSSECRRRR
jgi:hypothetical protein